MKYPKQLITSLCDQLPAQLTDFFTIEQRKIFSNYEDINSLVAETLWDFIKDSTAKADLRSVHGTQVKNRNQKRKRWTEAFQSGITTYTPSDKMHPLHFIYKDFENIDAHRFIKLYDALTVEEAVNHYKERYEEWSANDKTLLINCPLISSKTRNQILSCFKIDLIISLITIVMNSYDGNIDSYFSKKPALLIDNPVFSPDKFSVPLTASLDSYVADLVDYDSDNMVFQMFISQGKQDTALKKAKVFDQRDSHILMALINSITIDFYESRQISIEVGTIAKSINSRPNRRLYEDVVERLHNMALVKFRICKKDDPTIPIYTFSFFDDVLTKKTDNKEYVVVTFGHALYESITKKKMISVTSSNYNSLELNISKLLYHNLQKERISLYNNSKPNEEGFLYKAYDYSYFKRVVLFKKKSKASIIETIKNTLNEFVSKKIALAKYDFNPDSGQFHLYYFTLSDDEKADLLSITDNADNLLGFAEQAEE